MTPTTQIAAIRQKRWLDRDGDDVNTLLALWDTHQSALRALVAQWKQEAVDGLTAGEPDAFERAQVWAECSEELERLLSGPQP